MSSQVWEGWLSEDALPDAGRLRLEVLPLHDHELPWLSNEALLAGRPLDGPTCTEMPAETGRVPAPQS